LPRSCGLGFPELPQVFSPIVVQFGDFFIIMMMND
jgi:hypothetical protein